MRVTLETKRLLLRPFCMEDAEAMFEGWTHDPEVAKYVTWNAHESIEETRELLRQWVEAYEKPERLNFAIVLRESGELIGGIDVVGYLGGVEGTPVIGYNLARAFWNRGYMTEACQCLLAYLRSRGYTEVRIDAISENIGSIRVIEKCGGEFLNSEQEFFPLKQETALVNRYMVRLGKSQI